jgi:two-component system, sensor histidine kinase LadS
LRYLYSSIYGLLIGLPIALLVVGAIWLGYFSNEGDGPADAFAVPSSDISYYEDSNNALDVESIRELETSYETIQSGTTPNFGFNKSTIWLIFDLDGRCLADRHKIIEVKNPLLNKIELYEAYGDSITRLAIAGDDSLFSARGNNERNYCFEIDLPFERIHTYYIKLNSGGEQLLAPVIVWTEEGLAARNIRDQMIRGSYFGLILFVLFFNLFIYFIIREKSSLYYVYYNLFLFLLQLSLGGFAFQYFWPGSPYFANIATPLFATLSVFALIRFSQYFLEIQHHYPRVNRYFQFASYVLLANSFLCMIPHPNCFHISVLIVNGLALVLNFAIIPTAIGVIRKGFKPARIFLAAFLLLVLAVFGFLATNMGLIQSAFFADYGLLIGSAAEVILLSLAIVVRFKSFKDDALQSLQDLTVFQAEQNTVLEQKVEERTAEIQQQKEEILSSIRYAERIQKNVLPSANDLNALFPNHYIVYCPKDIVSGDFYWAGSVQRMRSDAPSNPLRLFATADCTGHGVPGAMVSVLGCNLLRETVLQFPNSTPDQMLHHLEDRLLMAISGTEHEHAGDGMDIALWTYDKIAMQLQFAGANINLRIHRNHEWIEFRATRRPIGVRKSDDHARFELHTIPVQSGDLIFTWTDGMPDMMGGEKGKKLKTSGVIAQLIQVVHLPLLQQRAALQTFITNWQLGTEQIDDITLTCVQID